MSLRGSLDDFSLPELFRLIDSGHKSGQLILQFSSGSKASEALSHYHYIWFWQGQIVAVTSRVDQQDLITLIDSKDWLSGRVTERLRNLCPKSVPLGLYLRRQGILKTGQLNALFREQLHRVRNLFELPSGHFEMNWQAKLPYYEMTGFGVRALKIALFTMRTMHNWQSLTDVLPKATSALQPLRDQPDLQLEPLEWHLWEFADGITPLATIVLHMNQSLILVQRAAFRLMIAGLVEEMPIAKIPNLPASSFLRLATSPSLESDDENKDPEKSRLNASFLQNLVGFLRSKV
jgi:hypothetical protein